MKTEKEKPPLLSGQINGGSSHSSSFNIRQALDDSSYFPEISEIYYNPILTEGCRTHSGTFNNNSGFKLNDFENISIDKISLLLNVPKINDQNPFLKKYWNYFDTKMIDMGVTEIFNGTYLYKNHCKWFHSYDIQWDNKKTDHKTVKIEFNPNKADLSKLVYFFSAMKSHAMNFARIGRIDIAVDYGIYLNPMCWHVKNIRKKHYITDSDIVKTVYFGSNKSDVQIKAYDKAFELKTEQGINIDKTLWRLEAEINNIRGDKPALDDIELVSNFNVFDRLSFYDSYGFKPVGSVMYNQFVYNCRAYGVGFAGSLLSKSVKYRCIKQLKEDMKQLSFNTPAEIHKNCFKRVYSRFHDKLLSLFEEGQKLVLHFSLTFNPAML